MLCLFVLVLAAVAEPLNLVKNPDFEAGEGWQPANWSRLDRLTSFWRTHEASEKVAPEGLRLSAGPPPAGKYLFINTKVLLSQYEARQKELDADPNAPPPAPLPVNPPGYDTVGGTKGVAIWSDPIPVDTAKYYNISCWCKGIWAQADDDFAPKIFVKGYAKFGKTGEYKEVVRKYLNCRPDSAKGWQWFTWSRPFAPGRLVKNATVEYVRLEVFCYWPLYEYGFDKIRFFEVPEPPEALKSPLETDREGKHGTAVSPGEEVWLSPALTSQANTPPAGIPEGLSELLQLLDKPANPPTQE